MQNDEWNEARTKKYGELMDFHPASIEKTTLFIIIRSPAATSSNAHHSISARNTFPRASRISIVPSGRTTRIRTKPFPAGPRSIST